MKRIAYLLIAAFLVVNQPSIEVRATAGEITDSSSFETDLDGWSIKATQVWGDPPEAWSITRSQDRARDGSTSLKFVLVNINDAEKIWIEKAFAVEPNQIYHVTVEYALATVDTIDAGPRFTTITGVLTNSPNSKEDLRPAFKDEAHNGGSGPGFQWDEKQYEFTVLSSEQGMLYVVIGIWGTWEVAKTYYVDDVRVSITKKPEGSEFHSFESDLQEWNANAADMESGGQPNDWSITRLEEVPLGGEDGDYSVQFRLNNLNENGKLWIERAFAVEPRRKYKVELDYAFHHYYCAGPPPKFRILAGVFRRRPLSGEDILGAVQEKTGITKCLWGWTHKSYSFKIKSKKSDTLYVVIGIWDTEKAHRTYNIDSVCVSVTPK
jgi:hypothetical protein